MVYRPKSNTKEVLQYVSVIFLARVKRYLAFDSICINYSNKSVCETMPLSPSVYQDLNTCHYWHVKNTIVDLPITMI